VRIVSKKDVGNGIRLNKTAGGSVGSILVGMDSGVCFENNSLQYDGGNKKFDGFDE